MLLKSSGTSDSLLFDIRPLRIVVRLLSNPFMIISILTRKVVLDTVDISYSVISLIMFKMCSPPDTIFFSIPILLILRL